MCGSGCAQAAADRCSSIRDRESRLIPDGIPRYIHCYDNGGKTADRYTVVFTGRYSKPGGEFWHLGMSAKPYHPQGVCLSGASREQIDYPRYGHLGKRIKFENLPDQCMSVVLKEYRQLWNIEKVPRKLQKLFGW